MLKTNYSINITTNEFMKRDAKMSKTGCTRFVISNVKIVGEWDWTKPQRCMICALEIRDTDDVVFCPYCYYPAHREHMLEWLHVKGICPHCRRPLRENKLIVNLEGSS